MKDANALRPSRRAAVVILGLLVLLVLAGAIWGRSEHPHFWWDRIPAFYALFGFLGAWLLVALRRRGERWLQRPEDYYEPRDDAR